MTPASLLDALYSLDAWLSRPLHVAAFGALLVVGVAALFLALVLLAFASHVSASWAGCV